MIHLVYAADHLSSYGFETAIAVYMRRVRWSDVRYSNVNVPNHVVTLTQVGTSVYLGQTHLGTPFQVPAWVRKSSLGSTGDKIHSLIVIQGLFVEQKFEY